MSELPQRLLTSEEVAQYLGFSNEYMLSCRCKRQGPDYYSIGGKVRYSVADVKAWLETRRICCATKKKYKEVQK